MPERGESTGAHVSLRDKPGDPPPAPRFLFGVQDGEAPMKVPQEHRDRCYWEGGFWWEEHLC